MGYGAPLKKYRNKIVKQYKANVIYQNDKSVLICGFIHSYISILLLFNAFQSRVENSRPVV